MSISNTHLLTEKMSGFWGFGNKTNADKINSELSEQGAIGKASDLASGKGGANSGRSENDGSQFWKDILIAGANTISQYGNQNIQDQPIVDVDSREKYDKEEVKILGMHPVTFGIVTITFITVAGVVVYKITK